MSFAGGWTTRGEGHLASTQCPSSRQTGEKLPQVFTTWTTEAHGWVAPLGNFSPVPVVHSENPLSPADLANLSPGDYQVLADDDTPLWTLSLDEPLPGENGAYRGALQFNPDGSPLNHIGPSWASNRPQ